MAEEQDERQGLPSASSMQRIMECKASLPLTNRLREQGLLPVDHGTEYSKKGDRVHEILAALATGAPLAQMAEFDPAEMEEALELWESAQQIITQVFGTELSDVEIRVEERIWLCDEDGEKMASGRFDLVAVSVARNQALILDYKTGHGDVPEPLNNWQTLTGAVIVWVESGVENFTAAIVQTRYRPQVAQYDGPAVGEALNQIDDALALKEADPFVVGFNPSTDRCKYCPARLACPRLHYDLTAIRAAENPDLIIATAPTPRLSQFLLACESVAILAKTAKAEMEHRLRNGETDEHWHMAASAGRRQVNDARALAQALIAEGATVDQTLAAMTITIGNAEAVLKAATNLKGKALTQRLNAIGEFCIETSQPEPSLKRK